MCPNVHETRQFEQVIALRQEICRIKGNETMCVVLQSNDFMEDDFHCDVWVTISRVRFNQLCPEDQSFKDSNQPAATKANLQQCLDLKDVVEFEADVKVDNDNEPAIENIPVQLTINSNSSTYSEWGHNVMCPPRMASMINLQPTLQLSTKTTVIALSN
jgi:hypothetical protein